MEGKRLVAILSILLGVGTVLSLPTYAVELKPEGIEAVRYVREGRFCPPAYAPEGISNAQEDKITLKRQRIREWPLTHPTLLEGHPVCDVNEDGRATIDDAAYLVNYIYGDGPAPPGSGDLNSDGRISIADAVFIVSYVYRAGPERHTPPLTTPFRKQHTER